MQRPTSSSEIRSEDYFTAEEPQTPDTQETVDTIDNAIDLFLQYLPITTTRKSRVQEKKRALQSANYSSSRMADAMEKLEEYIFVSSSLLLRPGTHARWVNKTDPKKELVKGSMICTTRNNIHGNESVVFKNYGPYARQFQLEMKDIVMFRRLTKEEMIIVLASESVANG